MTGFAEAPNLAVKTISEKEKKIGEAIEFATQMRLPTGNPAEHIATVVSVVAVVTNLKSKEEGQRDCLASGIAREGVILHCPQQEPQDGKDAGGHG